MFWFLRGKISLMVLQGERPGRCDGLTVFETAGKPLVASCSEPGWPEVFLHPRVSAVILYPEIRKLCKEIRCLVMFNARPLLSACYALVSYSIFSTRIFRIIDKFLCNLYFAWHFLFVYTDSWFIFLFRAANDLFYIYIKLDFRDGQISNHHVQLFPMVTKHQSNNTMFAMYRSKLYQTLSTHFERCEG